MKVIQNFSSKKHVKEFPIVDILIWLSGLIKLRAFGYTIKLYCEKKDYEFLKQWGLYDMYDEIDDTFMSENSLINSETINGTNFWSKRKIECIKHEFDVNTEPFIYMDTDIILNKGIDIEADTDLVVWSPETVEQIYVDWRHLSLPPNYIMPDYVFNTKLAYNCGILYFRTKQQFLDYRRHYLNYTIGNPCETVGLKAKESTIRDIWACNAEQRILKAIAEHNNWKVKFIMDTQLPGACEHGIHYYCLRGYWRLLKDGNEMPEKAKEYWLAELNMQLEQLLNFIAACDSEAFHRFLEVDWIKDFYETKNPIAEYK